MIIAYAETRSIGRLLSVGVKLKAGASLFKQYHPTLDKQVKRQRAVCINIKQEAPWQHTYLDGVNGRSIRSMA